jgi:hypothetical protein
MLTKQEMIQNLEEYWLCVAEDNPEEAENMDIPAAVEYYGQLSYEDLLCEYNSLVLEWPIGTIAL